MIKGQSGHLSLPEGPVGLGVVNSRQTPDVFVPPAKVGNQVNIVPTGADNINFVPEDEQSEEEEQLLDPGEGPRPHLHLRH